jgi:hypothetical protein
MKLLELLDDSAATAPFRDAAATFLRDPRPNDRIQFATYSPPVKVLRTLTKLIENYPDLEIERVKVNGQSGCEYFRGEMIVGTPLEERRIRFTWDCKWKALQLGWTDYFGFPDQTRAAREFDHDCFREWAELEVQVVVPSQA